MADCHLVRLSSTTSFFICLFRSLSVSSAGFSPCIRSRASASDLTDDMRCVRKGEGEAKEIYGGGMKR